MFPRDPCALHRCNSIPPINPYGKLHTLVVHNFIPIWSCYYKIPRKFSLLFREYFVPTALQFIIHIYTPTDNSRTYRVSAHSQLFRCFAKDFKISFDLPKIPSSLLLLKFSLAWIMVNPISFLILLASLVFIILSPLIQYVEDARIPQSNPRLHPSGSYVIWIWDGSWPINALIVCASKSIELIHFWSERLLLIPWFGNHKISLH